MEDSTAHGRYSLDPLCLPVEEGHIEAAREMHRDNLHALYTHLFSTGLLLKDSLELRANLIRLFVQVDEIPISWLDDAFGVNGREAWAIAQVEPIFLFGCLDCQEPICPKGQRHQRRLKRELEALCHSRVGEMMSTALLCGRCTELRLHQYNEECRAARLSQQARAARLYKMGAKYREEPEWKVKRTQALIRAGYRCQMGASHDGPLDVHHNTYQNYGNERPQDLVVLCRSCHEQIHGVVEDAS
jgi:5-methylcytosine-specific restriction endonuclease McrA